MWVILGVCVCMCDCVVGLFDFCVFICHDCTAAFFMRNKLNNNNKQCAYWFAVAQTQAGTVRHRKKVSTLAGRSLAGPGTSFAESRPDADAGVERRHEREIEQ